MKPYDGHSYSALIGLLDPMILKGEDATPIIEALDRNYPGWLLAYGVTDYFPAA